MTALVTKHLTLVAGAPDGVKKLRALILELAVRGKLVPHDLSDEPVATLLARTADAKAALQPRGRVKAKKSPNDLAGGYPYVVPSCWKWCRLADLVEVLNGRAYKKEELLEEGTPVLRVGNLFTSNHWYYSDLTLDEDRYCVPGDLLYAWSASFGPFIWSGERSIYHYHIWKLAPHSDADLCRRYLHDYLQAQTAAIKAAGHGVSMTHMTKEKMEQLPVPLPPLAEQHRIVAKVDELMALCDRLEADQADAEAAHAQLVQALLDSLTQATDAADFRASWQRLFEHFHTLFTTEASIDALKQTVLQLAVRGGLTRQDSGDEPAREFLKRIAEYRSRFDASRTRRTTLPSPVVAVTTPPFLIPDGWVWVAFGAVTICRDGERIPVSQADRAGRAKVYDYYGASGIIDKIDSYLFDKPLLLIGEDGANLINRTTPIAFIAKGKYWVNNHAHVIDGISVGFLQYIALYINAIDLKPYVTGTAQPKMNQSKLNGIPVPIPPESEQHRIVAKVNELMALCDQLKAQLVDARDVHAKLATALVEQAVA